MDDIEELESWYEDLRDWEDAQDEREQIESDFPMGKDEYWDPMPDWLKEWVDWYKIPNNSNKKWDDK